MTINPNDPIIRAKIIEPIIYSECVEFTQEDWDKATATFRRYHYGEFVQTAEQRRDTQIAREYHETCNAHDKRACSGTSRYTGEPMPVDYYEKRAVSGFAIEARHKLIAKYNLTDAEFHRIITTYNRSRA